MSLGTYSLLAKASLHRSGNGRGNGPQALVRSSEIASIGAV